jgi:hypothetical protein
MVCIQKNIHPAKNLTINVSFNYTKINTNGEQEQYDTGALTRTIGQRDYAEVMRTLINIRFSF